MLLKPLTFAQPVQKDLLDSSAPPVFMPPATVGQQVSGAAQDANSTRTPGTSGGLGGVITALVQSLGGGDGGKGGKGGGGSKLAPGFGKFGDINLDQFLESSTLPGGGGGGGADIGKIIGTLIKMFGGGGG